MDVFLVTSQKFFRLAYASGGRRTLLVINVKLGLNLDCCCQLSGCQCVSDKAFIFVI